MNDLRPIQTRDRHRTTLFSGVDLDGVYHATEARLAQLHAIVWTNFLVVRVKRSFAATSTELADTRHFN